MSVYVLTEYNHRLPDGSKVCVMSADTEDELHDMAKRIHIKPEKFSSESSVPFYIISKSQMKIARNNGVLTGEKAHAMIEYKKKYPNMIGK